MERRTNRIGGRAVACLLLLWTSVAAAQTDVKLAEEYLRQNEPEKAREIYRRLVKDDRVLPAVQRKYVQTLHILKAWDGKSRATPISR